MNLRINVRHATGHIETLSIESDRVMIGSGAHCDIRLAVDQARVEHVRIDVVPQGVFATAMSFEPQPTINGVAFTQAPLPPDAVLGIGVCQLQVHAVDTFGATSTAAKEKKSSPVMWIATAIAAVAIGGLLLWDPSGSAGGGGKAPPELWPSESVSSCPRGAGGIARTFAFETLTMAESKRERRAFHVRDGVDAVIDFETASACFRAAGEPQSAQYCDDAAKSLREEMGHDYRMFTERLRYHYKNGELQAAKIDVRNLLKLVGEGPDTAEYREYLKQLDRELLMRSGTGK